MPVLDNAIPACAAAFTPLLFALTFGEPVMKALGAGAPGACRAQVVPFTAELVLDWVAQDPGPSGAVLQGILFGRTAPRAGRAPDLRGAGARDRAPARSPCTRSPTPTCWPPSSRTARLIDANSIVELRVRPERLTAQDRRVRRRVLGRAAPAPAGVAPAAEPDRRLHTVLEPACTTLTATHLGMRNSHAPRANTAVTSTQVRDGYRGAGGPGGSTMSRPVGCSVSSSSSCQK